MKIEKLFRPIPTLSKRMFHTSRGRNLVAVLAILLTTMMFTTLFTPVSYTHLRAHETVA